MEARFQYYAFSLNVWTGELGKFVLKERKISAAFPTI
jgi:hypothetical protein